MRLQRSVDLVTGGSGRHPNRVADVDLRQDDNPVYHFVGAFRLHADVAVRYGDPAHLQCAVEGSEQSARGGGDQVVDGERQIGLGV